MKAKLKSGRVIKGKLAETFTRIGLATEVKAGRPPSKKVVEEEITKVPEVSDIISKTPVVKPGKKKTKK
jgi:hypothetical protein